MNTASTTELMPSHILGFLDSFAGSMAGIVTGIVLVILLMIAWVVLTCYRKVEQGQALVRNGLGGTRVSFGGMLVFPIIHRAEYMDISVKRIEIDRAETNGLICKDNIRADIKVAFFVRVNKTAEDVLHVAQAIGCQRASNMAEIRTLFDSKFSEALKTAGKRFEFTALYDERDKFRDEIVSIIGTNLNGFIMDDTSIDYLEQTPLTSLNPENILDAEGIKKITELTAVQAKLSNQIQRDKERVIRQQDVETAEAVLELDRQLAEKTAKQKREIESVKSREEAEAAKVREQERLKAEQARIQTEEELAVLNENKLRQIVVAQRNREKTDVVEQERVLRDKELEAIERERLTTLKSIEKEKAVEVEKKAIQDVIRERVMVEKTVVTEQQKIKDTEAFATAEREKSVALTLADKSAQELVIKRTKEAEATREAAKHQADQEAYAQITGAEASRKAAELDAQRRIIAADADEQAAEKEASAKKLLAEAIAKETAAAGMGEAEVVRAKSVAEAEGIQAKAHADAEGIREKAEAMKLFEQTGQAHEEFKLRLEMDRSVALAQIDVQKDIAREQAGVMGEALRHAKIDIVGGDTKFFDQITSAIGQGKAVDRLVQSSSTLTDVKETFFNGDPEYFRTMLKTWAGQFGVNAEDVKNLSVAAAIGKLLQGSPDAGTTGKLTELLATAARAGVTGEPAAKFLR